MAHGPNLSISAGRCRGKATLQVSWFKLKQSGKQVVGHGGQNPDFGVGMQAKCMRRLCLEVLAGMSEVAHVVGEAGTG